MSTERQKAVVAVMEALSESEERKEKLRHFYGFVKALREENESEVINAIESSLPNWYRDAANEIILRGNLLDFAGVIRSDVKMEAYTHTGEKFIDLPAEIQLRLEALIQAKLALDLENWMLDQELLDLDDDK